MKKNEKINKKEILINFEITSYEGHSEFKMVPKKALAYMQEQETKENKWLFVGGEHKSASLMTEQDLIDATTSKQTMTMMNSLAGGNTDGVIKTELLFNKKQKNSMVIDFVEHEFGRTITVTLKDEQMFPILNNRDVIRRAVQHVLTEKAEEEFDLVNDVAQEKIDELNDSISEIQEEADTYEEFLKVD